VWRHDSLEDRATPIREGINIVEERKLMGLGGPKISNIPNQLSKTLSGGELAQSVIV
jgi:hypothetical protein